MPVATIETKSVKVDDDLTDLSWLIQMNNNKQRYSISNVYNHENKNKKIERINKPFTVVNGQTIRSSIQTYSHDHQYSNEENQYYSQQSYNDQTIKRKFDSTLSYHHHHQPKRFLSGQTLPIYPTSSLPSESYYYNHPTYCTQPQQQQEQQQQQQQQRTSIPTTSRYMLLKNDPSLSDAMPTVHMSTNLNQSIGMIEHKNLYSDDIEDLLDIFKNEVQMIGIDPIATTSTGDCATDFGHCLSSNEFCPY
ncbi:unnamed protein product [Rotaria magnacalcarata]|uniref:Uncharacterized protein n=1 Tax=Rotaria magnacalcarata TaxID=392030 RepID=A0A815XK20_9BILA|nr:unnamed protein product [Rotaria magnacalcarata]CAF1558533.1 unnamed protein product [Rotaria magnacalcarata]CAF2044931.1 unnamed protein product [Rotaria magnacalcarata]CAF3864822.1 unnamed protein product [Rotaria magnacalcarata]CAF3910245.1 unnamed protein product [Rotaria magnacalcarata]